MGVDIMLYRQRIGANYASFRARRAKAKSPRINERWNPTHETMPTQFRSARAHAKLRLSRAGLGLLGVILYVSLLTLCTSKPRVTLANLHDITSRMLLSGDVESNPGPSFRCDSQEMSSFPHVVMAPHVMESLECIRSDVQFLNSNLARKMENIQETMQCKLDGIRDSIHHLQSHVQWLSSQQEHLWFAVQETEKRCEAYCSELARQNWSLYSEQNQLKKEVTYLNSKLRRYSDAMENKGNEAGSDPVPEQIDARDYVQSEFRQTRNQNGHRTNFRSDQRYRRPAKRQPSKLSRERHRCLITISLREDHPGVPDDRPTVSLRARDGVEMTSASISRRETGIPCVDPADSPTSQVPSTAAGAPRRLTPDCPPKNMPTDTEPREVPTLNSEKSTPSLQSQSNRNNAGMSATTELRGPPELSPRPSPSTSSCAERASDANTLAKERVSTDNGRGEGSRAPGRQIQCSMLDWVRKDQRASSASQGSEKGEGQTVDSYDSESGAESQRATETEPGVDGCAEDETTVPTSTQESTWQGRLRFTAAQLHRAKPGNSSSST